MIALLSLQIKHNRWPNSDEMFTATDGIHKGDAILQMHTMLAMDMPKHMQLGLDLHHNVAECFAADMLFVLKCEVQNAMRRAVRD